jgi:O-antigen/teichoic acid export membrane protein
MNKPQIGSLLRFSSYAFKGFSIAGVSRVLLLVLHVLLGRSLGPTGYGAFALAYGLSFLIGQLGTFGLHQTLPRFMAQYESQEQWSLLRGLLIRAEQVSLISSSIAGICLVAGAYLFEVNEEIFSALLLAGICAPLFTVKRLRGRQLISLGRVRLGIILDEGVIPIVLIAFWLAFGIQSATQAMLLLALTMLPVVAIMTIAVIRLLPQKIKKAASAYSIRQWIRVSLPTILGQSASLIMARVDVLILAPLVGITAVGYFSSAYRVAYAIQFFPEVLGLVTAPLFAKAFFRGEYERLRRLFIVSISVSIAISLPVVLLLILGSGPLLEFTFGPKFEPAQPLLVILCIGQLFNAFTGPVAPFLIAIGRERVFGAVCTIVALLNVFLNLMLIPIYGAMGAAVVSAMSLVILNTVMLVAAIVFLQNINNSYNSNAQVTHE